MGDSVSFRMFTEPFTRAIEQREHRMPGAARWAVREAGRAARAAARAEAPVLKDKTLSRESTLRRYRKRGFDTSAAYDRPVPGLLKASIRSSRNLTRHGEAEFSLKVGPRGERVHLYAAKIEEQAHYMEAGRRAAHVAMTRGARQAFERVWRG